MNRRRRKLSEPNLIDGFLFNTVLSHEQYGPVTARILISTIIGRDIKIRKLETEKVFLPPDTDRRGIRLDAYVEEEQTDVSQGDYFDIEPDNKRNEKKLLPKRSRYYHSRMDGKILKVNESYDKLPSTWVIFITSFDPFGENRMVYTIKNRCIESPEMDYEDGATTLFLNLIGEPGDIPQELKELLTYIRDTSSENAVNPNLKEIQRGIDEIKTEPSVREAYMTWEEFLRSEVENEVAEIREELRDEVRNEVRDEVRNEVRDEVRDEIDSAHAEAAEAKNNLLSAKAEIESLKAELKKYRAAENE